MNLSLTTASVRRIIAEISPHGWIVLHISCRSRGTKIPGATTTPSTRGWRQLFFPLDRFEARHEPTLKALAAQDNESVGKGPASSLLPRTNLHIPQTGRPVCFEGLHVSRINLVSHVQCRHLSEEGVPNPWPCPSLLFMSFNQPMLLNIGLATSSCAFNRYVRFKASTES